MGNIRNGETELCIKATVYFFKYSY